MQLDVTLLLFQEKLNIEEYELLYAINDECDKMVAECYTGYIISQK